jgi:hypothetical protein
MANKVKDGKQCTKIWHVDDVNISHISKEVVEDIIKALIKKFWKESPPRDNTGQSTMMMDYSSKGK